MHGPADLTGLAIVAVVATLCGMAMVRIRQPAIIGYILAGLVLGPSGLSLVENREAIDLLAQLGVIMLLFFIGMELSLRSFRTIWKVALISTAAQITLSVGALYVLGSVFEWPLEWAILFGFCLALSSTAVAVKVLEDTGELRTTVGRLAIGILIAQDLAVAPMLIVISNLATDGDGGIGTMVFEVSASIAILVGIILFLTRKSKVNLPFHHLVSPNTDLKPMAALAFCFGIATVLGLVGLSPAFGAFLAGLIVGNSAQRQEVHENAGPIQAVLLMVFFLSIGLLIDLQFVWQNFGLLLAIVVLVTVFKTILTAVILRLLGESWQSAFSVASVTSQMGEFSFVMAAVALSATVISPEIHKMIVALTVFSLVTSPLMFDLNRRLNHRAAGQISDLGALFRFAYFREWQITKRLSRAILQGAYDGANWMSIRVETVKDKAAKKLAENAARKKIEPPPSSNDAQPKDTQPKGPPDA